MDTIFTPLHLKLLLHAYSHPEPWPHNGGCAHEYEQQLVLSGLIQSHASGHYYECTQKGRAHVEQLCRLPFPTQVWMAANGEILKLM